MPPKTDEQVIVFSGNMEYHPNLSAVRFFARQVWPRLRKRWPLLVWRLVGKTPHAVEKLVAGDPRIELSGAGGGCRGRTGAGAGSGGPVAGRQRHAVQDPGGLGGGVAGGFDFHRRGRLPARDGEHLLLADTAAAFADAVSRLLTCKDLRMTVGNSGRSLLEKEFTWDSAWAGLDF